MKNSHQSFTISSQRIAEEKTFSNSFHVSITLTPKSDKDITRKLQANIPYEYRSNNFQPDTSKPEPEVYKEDLFQE